MRQWHLAPPDASAFKFQSLCSAGGMHRVTEPTFRLYNMLVASAVKLYCHCEWLNEERYLKFEVVTAVTED